MLRQPTISTRTDNLLPYRTLFRSRGQVMEVVRAAFRPEFLNRLDEILLFRRLSREDMTGIVDIQLQRLQALLAERKITLELDDRARAWLAEAGYDRSEEHTAELQSLMRISYAVFCLKKKQKP